MRGFYCYKWIVDDEVVYVGKTINLESRFYQEMRSGKFMPYLDADIYVVEFPNASEMDAVEKLLINKYQPTLNVKEKHILHSKNLFDDSSLLWNKYEIPRPDTSRCKLLRKRKLIDELKEKIEKCKKTIKDGSFYMKMIGYIDDMIVGNIKNRTFPLDKDNVRESFSMNIPGDIILDIVDDQITLTDEEKDKISLLNIDIFTWPNGERANINIAMEGNLDFFFENGKDTCMFKIFKIVMDNVWEDINKAYEEIEEYEKIIKEQEETK